MAKKDLKKKTSKPVTADSDSRNPKVEIDESGKCRIVQRSREFGFGTKDEDLILNTINQLSLIFKRGKDEYNEWSLMMVNATIASIAEIKPKDSIELMLATQMATIHNAAMNLMERAMLVEQTFEGVDANINRANKLMRTFTAQVEALNKYRTKGQQKITVQHVNVNDGGQAIVGDVGVGNG